MFRSTPVQVLSVVKIAPGSGSSCGSALGARNNPATITAIDINIFEVGFILLVIYFLLICWGYDCWTAAVTGPRRILSGLLVHVSPSIPGTAGRSSEKRLGIFQKRPRVMRVMR